MKDYDNKFLSVSILGAAGKMGSGIVLCLVEYFAKRALSGDDPGIRPSILAIDTSTERLQGLNAFLRAHLTKFAERNIVRLRRAYLDLESVVENSEHIDYFVMEMLSFVTVSTDIRPAASSELVFEATPEDPGLKVKLFSEIMKISSTRPWILSNTSSVPISELDEQSGLEGNIIGFHFYNPPAVQKLLEIIPSENTNPDLKDFSYWLATELGKTIVEVKDVAGFAGNGVFIREISYALNKTAELRTDVSWEKAVLIIDRITRDYLIRPMGIFQLIDYVGLDICVSIAEIMQKRLKEDLNVKMLRDLVGRGIRGGQFSNGMQRDGIFKYEKNRPVAIYDPERNDYLSLNEIEAEVSGILGNNGDFPKWKLLRRDREASIKLKSHFETLFSNQGTGAAIAREYFEFYKNLSDKLLEQKVVMSEEDLNRVMMLGFQHLYGPFNDYV